MEQCPFEGGTAVLDYLIVADDLTGACDAAGPFAAAGWKTAVRIAGEAPDCEVLGVSTETRDREAGAIPAAMREAAAMGPARVVFKKIDSTLRGHTGVEIRAAMEAFGCEAVVACPAFPGTGRVVRGGRLSIEGTAGFEPVAVAERLACVHVRLSELSEAFGRGERVVSVDAVCDGDLDEVATAITRCEGRVLGAGSAGLAGALARVKPARARGASTGREAYRAEAYRSRVVFAIGSEHPVTVAQVEALMAQRDALLLRLPYGQVAAGSIVKFFEEAAPSALVLSGGTTAALVCGAIGAQSIEICEELIPGVPRGVLRGGMLDGIEVVTKSGGFGACDALIRIADYFYGG